MCPSCYINALLFTIFGASAAAIANNPWVIALSIVLTIFALYWLYKGWKKTYTRNIYEKFTYKQKKKGGGKKT